MIRRSGALLVATAALIALPAASASATERPPVHCDPMACPDPVAGVQECVNNGITAIRYILQGTPQPQTCSPWNR